MRREESANVEQTGVVSIWVGSFPTVELLEEYLKEQYEDDDVPISRFADDTGLDWYDHDLLEAQRYDEPLPVSVAISPLSFSASYIDAATEAAVRLGMGPIDTVVLLIDCSYTSERAARMAPSPLSFLGVFPYDENAAPAEGGDVPQYAR